MRKHIQSPQTGGGFLHVNVCAHGGADFVCVRARGADEKWLVRIWRHQDRVPPPFGLADGYVADDLVTSRRS